MKSSRKAAVSRLRAWLGLALVLAAFLAYLHSTDPASGFGQAHDDAIYFTAAQALAEGKGHRLASLPGEPPQTKYPILWPWILSWVWKFFPVYPANVAIAVWITAVFACWFLVVSFVILRRFPGLGDKPALFLVALSAFQPFFVLLAGGLMSDLPFAALALTGAALGDRALRPHSQARLSVAAGVFAGLSVLMRSLGVSVLVGLAAAALLRRAWRPLLFFFVAAMPVVLLGRLAAVQAAPLTGFSAEGGGPGWQQTWIYYTSYLEFWKLNVRDFRDLAALFSENLQFFLQTPSVYCLFPMPGWLGPQLGGMLGVTLTAAILAGIVRQVRSGGFHPFHGVFVAYVPMVLVWNYGSLMGRFLIPFLPLLYAGLWTEGSRLGGMLRRSLGGSRPMPEKLVAGALAFTTAVVAAASVNHYVRGFRVHIHEQAALRTAVIAEREELYDWIRNNTPPDTRFVTFEDATLYLATRRQAIWPIAFLPAGIDGGDQGLVNHDLAHFHDVARHVGARYWVSAESQATVARARDSLIRHYAGLKTVLPLIYRTSHDRFRVYDLSCVQHPEEAKCESAVPILFPAGSPDSGASRTAATF
jgi:hypothetical protein